MAAAWKACWSKDEQDKAMEEASELLRALENELKDKKFFGGDRIGLVDIAADFIGFWLRLIQEVTGAKLLTKEKFPKLCDWIDEFLSCNAVKESLPPRELLLAFLQARVFPSSAPSISPSK
ncbi:hypothetical protein RJ639_003392 [Escallonia herrerae]|uniref:GST C-terminal domain-containing protein n=1 Tax=Escallonia herrerae TaxID=1293975 RepID=A0AA89AY47_9ASTE|nr:hypothetical protein RJ639_003392 [Escallonia herrerae]